MAGRKKKPEETVETAQDTAIEAHEEVTPTDETLRQDDARVADEQETAQPDDDDPQWTTTQDATGKKGKQRPRGPRPPKTTKQKITDIAYHAVLFICVVVFSFAATVLIRDSYYRWKSRDLNAQLQGIAPPSSIDGFQPPDPNATRGPHVPMPQPEPPEGGYLAELKKKNPDIVGWIRIPNTTIDYPVVRHPKDNTYYLTHAFDRSFNGAGSIYMDHRNDGYFHDNNSVLYGHRRNDGQMFYDLENKFRSKAYVEAHPTIEIITENRYLYATIFAVCVFPSVADYRQPNYDTPESFATFMSLIDSKNEVRGVNGGIKPVYGDRILTLSTCNYDYNSARLVVFAVFDERYFEYRWEAFRDYLPAPTPVPTPTPDPSNPPTPPPPPPMINLPGNERKQYTASC